MPLRRSGGERPCALAVTRSLALSFALLAAPALAIPPVEPVFDFCQETRPVVVAAETVGHLCIVAPSTTDLPGSAIHDLDPDCTLGPDGLCARGNGYGNHVIGLPNDMNADSPIALLISGAYGAPHSPIEQDHLGIGPGEIRYTATLVDAVATGHVVIQLAYRNPGSVNRDFCSQEAEDFADVDPHPALNPQCHYLLRTLQLDGFQQCPVFDPDCEPIPAFQLSEDGEVDLANAYFLRLDLLLDHLLATPLDWPTALSPFDWSQLRLLGHSQGSGHAYLIATLRHEVRRVCYLAGPRDYARDFDDYADWFRPYPAFTKTPKDAMRAMVSESDAWRAIQQAWPRIALEIGHHTGRLPDPVDFGDGHEEIISSPVYASDRITACLSDDPLPLEVPEPTVGGQTFAILSVVLGSYARRRGADARSPNSATRGRRTKSSSR